jgi:hypothetical protein
MCERGQAASHNESQGDQNIRPKQLRNREVPWEGSHRSKLMSRRTERPYKVDGMGKLAPHSAAPCSVPEINGPVVQQEFTFLLREACGPSPSTMMGAMVGNFHRAGAGVSRGHSTESNEPAIPTGWSHNSGRAELGRQTRPSMVLFRKRRRRLAQLPAAIIVAEKEWLRHSARDCQEPPYADPHVRWCGRREGDAAADPISPWLSVVTYHLCKGLGR